MLQAVVLCSKKNFQITKQGNALLYIEFIIVYITYVRLVHGHFTDGVGHFQYFQDSLIALLHALNCWKKSFIFALLSF